MGCFISKLWGTAPSSEDLSCGEMTASIVLALMFSIDGTSHHYRDPTVGKVVALIRTTTFLKNPDFEDIMNEVPPEANCSLIDFCAQVANKLFVGKINFGRVLAYFCFLNKMLENYYEVHGNLFRHYKFGSLLADEFHNQGILKVIESQGGYRAMLRAYQRDCFPGVLHQALLSLTTIMEDI